MVFLGGVRTSIRVIKLPKINDATLIGLDSFESVEIQEFERIIYISIGHCCAQHKVQNGHIEMQEKKRLSRL